MNGPGKAAAPVRQAVVLAGGRGSRMWPLTRTRPKALVDVHGTPILRHQLDWLAESGIEQVVVSAGHLAPAVSGYLAALRLPLRTDVVVEERPLGRGGGLKLAASALARPDEPWLALYGDIWTRFPLAGMYAHHRRHQALATVALPRPWLPRGRVDCDAQGHVTSLNSPAPPPLRVNGGVYLFEPCVVPLLPDEGDHEETTLPRLVAARQLLGYPTDAPWRALNTPRDLTALEHDLTPDPSHGP